MSTSTTVRSWSAIGVAAFFFLVTCFVLFGDVLLQGAPITIKHATSFSVLLGTCYFGHAFWPQIVSWQIGRAMGCALLFMAGTVFCVILSAGRNAETTMNKADDTRAANVERHRLEKELVTAKASYKAIVDSEDLTLKEARLRYKTALTAEETECSDGQGGRCLKRRAVTADRRKDVDAAETARRDAIEMHRKDAADAETKLAKLPPERIPNAELKAAAELLAKLPFITTPPEGVEALLLVFSPFLQALFCEIATIVAFSIGLGHVVRELPRMPLRLPYGAVTDAVTVPSMMPTANAGVSEPVATPASTFSVAEVPQVTESYRKAKKQRPTDVQLVLDALEREGRPVSNQELADALSCSEGESSKRLRNCGDAVIVRRAGRYYSISPNYAMTV